jgi:hypothetical protein
VYVFLEQYGGCLLVGTWIVGGVPIYFRFLLYQLAYLRQFPPVNGVPLDRLGGYRLFSPESRARFRAVWMWQPTPELERTRQVMLRRYGLVALWVFGFPLLAGGLGLVALAVIPH